MASPLSGHPMRISIKIVSVESSLEGFSANGVRAHPASSFIILLAVGNLRPCVFIMWFYEITYSIAA